MIKENKVDATFVDVCKIPNPEKILYLLAFSVPCLVFVRMNVLQNPKPEDLGELSWNAPCMPMNHLGFF